MVMTQESEPDVYGAANGKKWRTSFSLSPSKDTMLKVVTETRKRAQVI